MGLVLSTVLQRGLLQVGVAVIGVTEFRRLSIVNIGYSVEVGLGLVLSTVLQRGLLQVLAANRANRVWAVVYPQ